MGAHVTSQVAGIEFQTQAGNAVNGSFSGCLFIYLMVFQFSEQTHNCQSYIIFDAESNGSKIENG